MARFARRGGQGGAGRALRHAPAPRLPRGVMSSCGTKQSSDPTSCSSPNAFADLRSQPFPTRGPLASRMDSGPAGLCHCIPESQQRNPVYVYIVTTVKVQGARFVQEGSAPNFQGGSISLCTCKHKDRASPPPLGCRGPNRDDPWKGVWVAGLCSPSQARPRGLFYLMRVEATFPSHAKCWEGLGRPLAKSAHIHPFGDIYEPLPAAFDAPWSKENYKGHLSGHCHGPGDRKKDIEVGYYSMQRHPRLLVGDVRRSFLWSAPQITLNFRADADWKTAHHRFYPRLSDFLSLLQ
jgi:hypothetical protein